MLTLASVYNINNVLACSKTLTRSQNIRKPCQQAFKVLNEMKINKHEQKYTKNECTAQIS